MKYQITPTERGVFLKMWEPSPITEVRHKPYDILIQRWLASEAEAFQAIEEYLEMQPGNNSIAQPAESPQTKLQAQRQLYVINSPQVS